MGGGGAPDCPSPRLLLGGGGGGGGEQVLQVASHLYWPENTEITLNLERCEQVKDIGNN